MSPDPLRARSDELKQRARSLGFSLVGIAPPDPSLHIPFLRSWLTRGFHGEMAYLAREDAVARRADLRTTLKDVRAAVLVGHEYNQPDPDGVPEDPSRAVVARYARGRDYHRVVKKKLLDLARWIDSTSVAITNSRTETYGLGDIGRPATERSDRSVGQNSVSTGRTVVYVDTGPILERDLAQKAGLGWFGKNTMLIHPRRGSWFFLGVLLTPESLATDEPFGGDRCGTCSRCLEACPTGALQGYDGTGAPVMDARRCISYLTIEHRGVIPEELRPLMGNRIFGCDICQEVCPWNERFAAFAEEPDYRAREGLDGPLLVDLGERLLAMDDGAFAEAFRGSPVRRAGRGGLLRNVCIGVGNWLGGKASASAGGMAMLRRAARDGDALVREHAEWALRQIRDTQYPD